MQIKMFQGNYPHRIIMAYIRRSLTTKEAWRIFEKYIQNVYTIEEAAAWLRRHPHIAKKMTGAGLLRCFDEDIKAKK